MDTTPVVCPETLQQPVRDRDDDWFVLLDVASRKLSFVPPGSTLLHLCFKAAIFDFCLILFSSAFMSGAVSQGVPVPVGDSVPVVKTETTEWKEQTIEAAIDETKLEQEIFLPQTEKEDLWFVLLDVPNRESLFVPPGMKPLVIPGVFSNAWHQCCDSGRLLCLTVVAMADYAEVYPAESIPVEAQSVPSVLEVVVEEMVVQKKDTVRPESAVKQEVKQSFRERSDDWFLLLDVVSRETAYVPPGICFHQLFTSDK